MFQKYGSDKIRNLLIDKLDGAAFAYQTAAKELADHDEREKKNADLIARHSERV